MYARAFLRWGLCLAAALGLVACGARSDLPGSARQGQGGDQEGGGGAGGEGAGGSGVGGVEQVVLGAGHSCVRTKAGDVACWGRNRDGQLGLGDTDDRLSPTYVSLAGPATYLSAGTYHTCAVLVDGRTFCWGNNSRGQLGIGSSGDDASTPTQLQLPATPQALALGEEHSCAALGDFERSLFCWGSGVDGQNGVGTNTDLPAQVTLGVGDVAAGAFHTCFTQDGQIRCMGSNFDGECGQSGPVSAVLPAEVPEGLEATVAEGVFARAGHHTCATIDKELYCWGDNSNGQLGLGFVTDNELVRKVSAQPAAALRGAAPGFAHTCALFGDTPYCWGDNYGGQLGTGGPDAASPTPLARLSGVRAVGTGSIHSCAYVSQEEIYCWGGNAFGQIGDGTTEPATLPVRIQLP